MPNTSASPSLFPLLLLSYVISTTSSSVNSPYPVYCSNLPTFTSTPRIPPLPPAAHLPENQNLELLTSTIIIRHGARTPYSNHGCWEGYEEDEMQSQWNCTTSMVMTTTPTTSDYHLPDSNLLFKKVYDSLPHGNALKGTCHVGQLLSTGVLQEKYNGESLRESYIDASENPDIRLKLFKHSSLTHSFNDGKGGDDNEVPLNEVYFRGDDQQRTLMSGQLLIAALFPTPDDPTVKARPLIVDWHTADYEFDWIYPNSDLCPRLKELEDEVDASEGFREMFEESVEGRELNKTMEEMGAGWYHMSDCMVSECHEGVQRSERKPFKEMAAICNDRSLPPQISDFTPLTDESPSTPLPSKSTFQKIYSQTVSRYAYLLTYKNSTYAKLSMQPLLKEVLSEAVVPSRTASSKRDVVEGGKRILRVYSGHDTTVMPVLEAMGVWDGKWANYAALIALETYSLTPGPSGKKGFRLIYEGQVITQRLPGCALPLGGGSELYLNGEICDLEVLIGYLEEVVGGVRECGVSSSSSSRDEGGGCGDGSDGTEDGEDEQRDKQKKRPHENTKPDPDGEFSGEVPFSLAVGMSVGFSVLSCFMMSFLRSSGEESGGGTKAAWFSKSGSGGGGGSRSGGGRGGGRDNRQFERVVDDDDDDDDGI